jgi:hypothetical protein
MPQALIEFAQPSPCTDAVAVRLRQQPKSAKSCDHIQSAWACGAVRTLSQVPSVECGGAASTLSARDRASRQATPSDTGYVGVDRAFHERPMLVHRQCTGDAPVGSGDDATHQAFNAGKTALGT